MAPTPTKPNFRKFASLQSEPAKGSLDPHREDEEDKADATDKREKLTISQYRDPRDWLDHERHAMRAEARQESDQTDDDLPETEGR